MRILVRSVHAVHPKNDRNQMDKMIDMAYVRERLGKQSCSLRRGLVKTNVVSIYTIQW